MKKIYYLAAALGMICISNDMVAKNTRIGTDRFKSSVYKYPTITLPAEQTFDFELVAPGQSFGIYPSNYSIYNFGIAGWRSVATNPAISITTVMDNLVPSAGSITERCEVKKRRIRKRDTSYYVKDTVILYRAEMQVLGRSFVEARDAQGNLVFRRDIGNFMACTATPEFRNRRAVKQYLDRHMYDIGIEHMNDYYSHAIAGTQITANDHMAHYEYKKDFKFYVIKRKSDKLYAKFNSKMNDMQRILEGYSPTRNKEETKRRLVPYIAYLKHVSSINVKDNRTKKIKFMALHNLSTALNIVEDYQAAGSYAQNWRALGYKKLSANNLLKLNNYAMNNRAKNNWNF